MMFGTHLTQYFSFFFVPEAAYGVQTRNVYETYVTQTLVAALLLEQHTAYRLTKCL